MPPPPTFHSAPLLLVITALNLPQLSSRHQAFPPDLASRPIFLPRLPHTLGHGPHGLLGDKDVAGKAAQQRVFGDEAKIAAGGVGAEGHQSPDPHLRPPRGPEARLRSRGLGRRVGVGKRVGHRNSRCEGGLLGSSPSTVLAPRGVSDLCSLLQDRVAPAQSRPGPETGPPSRCPEVSRPACQPHSHPANSTAVPELRPQNHLRREETHAPAPFGFVATAPPRAHSDLF